MKKYFLPIVLTLLSALAFAGNPDRAGGAGGTQLLLNPFGRSAGLMNANTASLRGAEAMMFNVGGLAYTEKTEIILSQMVYLQGTSTFYNNVSLAQHLGGGNVLGITASSIDPGNILLTSEALPDGDQGTFTPQYLNFGLAYSKKFSNSITGGMLLRIFNEGVNNVKARGVAIDAGVQYQTALNPKNKIKKEDFRFGIAVRNIGADAVYSGSGLAYRTTINPGTSTSADRKTEMGSQAFNLPALVHIGASYDIRLDKDSNTYIHRLTPSANFNYNAFSNNITSVGVEYAYRESFMVRGGYGIQGNNSGDDYRSQYIGFAGGMTIQLPISKSGTILGLDYAYAPTRVFNGNHNITLRMTLGNKKS
jgi:hypothetical protein